MFNLRYCSLNNKSTGRETTIDVMKHQFIHDVLTPGIDSTNKNVIETNLNKIVNAPFVTASPAGNATSEAIE